jgi:hypothetical protein
MRGRISDRRVIIALWIMALLIGGTPSCRARPGLLNRSWLTNSAKGSSRI